MQERKKPDREQRIALMVQAQNRLFGHAQKWMADPEVKAALHRYDRHESGRGSVERDEEHRCYA